MFTPISRRFVVALALLAAGCDDNRKPDPGPIASAEALQRARANADGHIICAVPGSDDFARQCELDRTYTADGTVLTVRQPDGGFHRLLITHDGRGVIAADGAEPAKVTVIGDGLIEVAIGGARYRLPAKIGPLPK